MPTKPTIIELDMDKLDEILRRVEAKELRDEDYETIRTVIESYVGLYFAVGDKNTTIPRLRKMLFGAKTEKTAAVIGDRKDSQLPPTQDAVAAAASRRARRKPRQRQSRRQKRGGNAAKGPRPQRGRRLHGRREDRGASRVASAGRSLPEVRQRARSTRRTGPGCWCGW